MNAVNPVPPVLTGIVGSRAVDRVPLTRFEAFNCVNAEPSTPQVISEPSDLRNAPFAPIANRDHAGVESPIIPAPRVTADAEASVCVVDRIA